MSDHPRIEVTSRAQWRAWLEQHHDKSGSIWLVTYKKCVPDNYVSYDAVVEEALCFGWIDSVRKPVDETRTMIRVSPRKRGSEWSRVNKVRIERLIEQGLMMPPGVAAVESAKADRSWSLLDEADALKMPEDLRRALAKAGEAASDFDAYTPSVKRRILWWIAQAKRPETRAQRIQHVVARAAAKERDV